MAKFKFSVSTGYVGCKREEIYEIDDEDFEGLDEKDKEELIEEHYEEWLTENINCAWEEIEE